ncbi:MAG TPA: ATP-binding protein [Candidatus Saccharimonadales bacterium]|jgi:signal transduction histidine kinase/HAMP domain-containing protein
MKKHKYTRGFKSLSATLALSFVILSLCTLLVAGCINTYFAYRSESRAITDRQQLVAGSAARTVKGFMDDKLLAASLSTKLYNLSSGNTQSSQLALSKLLGIEPAFRYVKVVDTNGVLKQQISRNASFSTSTSNDSKALLETVKSGKNYIGPVYIDTVTSEPLVEIATPIQDVFKDYKGALVAEVNLKFMWELVDNIKVGQRGQAYVVNKDGSLIAYKDTSRVLARENLKNLEEVDAFIRNKSIHAAGISYTATGINGGKVVASHAALRSPAWAVIVEMPVNEAYAPIIRNLYNSLLVFLLSALAATAAGYYVSRRITRPLVELQKATEQIGQGDLAVRTNIAVRNEIGELARAFNAMAQGLQTSGQKLYDEHARLKASIDSLDVGLLMTFKDDQAISYNTVMPKILGLGMTQSGRQITLQALRTKLLTKGFDLIQSLEACQQTGESFEVGEISYDDRILRIFGAPIMGSDDRIIGAIVLLDDITEAKVLERSKDEFFSIASHELRTPLTSIKGNSSMILEYYKEALKDDQLKEMVDDMHTSSVRLIDIVNDFLDLSRLEQGKIRFNYEATHIEPVIESVVYEMRPVLDEKKIYLKLDELTLNTLPQVWVDKNRLKQVVYNLVGNAAKFTDEGGIMITARLDRAAQAVKVLVSDTGRGMTIESQKLLFHKFQQASSSLLTRDTTRGTGLGLYISKMIVENMGGAIALDESVEGKGTTFSFTIPLATPEQQNNAAASRHDTITDTATGLTVQDKSTKTDQI